MAKRKTRTTLRRRGRRVSKRKNGGNARGSGLILCCQLTPRPRFIHQRRTWGTPVLDQRPDVPTVRYTKPASLKAKGAAPTSAEVFFLLEHFRFSGSYL